MSQKISDAWFAKMSQRYEQEQGGERQADQGAASGTEKERGPADGH